MHDVSHPSRIFRPPNLPAAESSGRRTFWPPNLLAIVKLHSAPRAVAFAVLALCCAEPVVGKEAPNDPWLYLPREAAAAINLICAADTACEALSVKSANINNDDTDDYAIFVLGNEECGGQNCPLFFVISKGTSFRTLDTQTSAPPDSLRWLAPKGEARQNTLSFFGLPGDKCRTIWTWQGDTLGAGQESAEGNTCPRN